MHRSKQHRHFDHFIGDGGVWLFTKRTRFGPPSNPFQDGLAFVYSFPAFLRMRLWPDAHDLSE